MITDGETDCVYLSDLLLQRHPWLADDLGPPPDGRRRGSPHHRGHKGHLVPGLHADPGGGESVSFSSTTSPTTFGAGSGT